MSSADGIPKNALSSPKAQNALRAMLSAKYAEQAQKGDATLVTQESADPRLAQLAKDLESVFAHPLCAQFLTERPRIYVTASPMAETAGGIKRKELVSMPFAAASSKNTIVMNKEVVDLLDPKELKAVISHEIGHILQGDLDARNGLVSDKKKNQRMERGADKLGAIISAEPDALKSGLSKMNQLMGETLKDKVTFKDKVIERAVKYGDRTHPNTRSRSHTIDKVAEAMKDPSEKRHLEAEMARRLAESVRYR
jgi:Zn-dependent protease with chaperone function